MPSDTNEASTGGVTITNEEQLEQTDDASIPGEASAEATQDSSGAITPDSSVGEDDALRTPEAGDGGSDAQTSTNDPANTDIKQNGSTESDSPEDDGTAGPASSTESQSVEEGQEEASDREEASKESTSAEATAEVGSGVEPSSEPSSEHSAQGTTTDSTTVEPEEMDTTPEPAAETAASTESTPEESPTVSDGDESKTRHEEAQEETVNSNSVASSGQGPEEGEEDGEEKDTESESESKSDTEAASQGGESEEQDLTDVKHMPGQFEVVIDANELHGFFDKASVLVDECRLRIGEDGLLVRAVDPANVGMIDETLGEEAFESYHATPGVFGINIERAMDVLSFAGKSDKAFIELNTDTRKLTITVNEIEYTLALIDPRTIREEPDIPDLALADETKIKSGALKQAVKAGKMVSDHIKIKAHEEHEGMMMFSAEGDTDDVDLIIREADDEFVAHSGRKRTSSLFSIEYLSDMAKATPRGEVITMETGEDFPTKLHFSDSHAECTFMLAPRIEA